MNYLFTTLTLFLTFNADPQSLTIDDTYDSNLTKFGQTPEYQGEPKILIVTDASSFVEVAQEMFLKPIDETAGPLEKVKHLVVKRLAFQKAVNSKKIDIFGVPNAENSAEKELDRVLKGAEVDLTNVRFDIEEQDAVVFFTGHRTFETDFTSITNVQIDHPPHKPPIIVVKAIIEHGHPNDLVGPSNKLSMFSAVIIKKGLLPVTKEYRIQLVVTESQFIK